MPAEQAWAGDARAVITAANACEISCPDHRVPPDMVNGA